MTPKSKRASKSDLKNYLKHDLQNHDDMEAYGHPKRGSKMDPVSVRCFFLIVRLAYVKPTCFLAGGHFRGNFRGHF